MAAKKSRNTHVNLPGTAPKAMTTTRKKTRQPVLTEKEQASRQIHVLQAKMNRRRECCHIRGATARKSKDCEFGEQTDDKILEHLIQTIKDSELVKRSIHKKWNLDQFLEEASHREDINRRVKDMKEDFKISKVGYQPEIIQRVASGEEETRRNHRELPENETARKKRKRKAKAMVTVESQEHTRPAETAQHTDNNGLSVLSTMIMHHVSESVPKPKRDLIRRPGEGESRKQQRLRRQAVTQTMLTSTFRRQHNAFIE